MCRALGCSLSKPFTFLLLVFACVCVCVPLPFSFSTPPPPTKTTSLCSGPYSTVYEGTWEQSPVVLKRFNDKIRTSYYAKVGRVLLLACLLTRLLATVHAAASSVRTPAWLCAFHIGVASAADFSSGRRSWRPWQCCAIQTLLRYPPPLSASCCCGHPPVRG